MKPIEDGDIEVAEVLGCAAAALIVIALVVLACLLVAECAR